MQRALGSLLIGYSTAPTCERFFLFFYFLFLFFIKIYFCFQNLQKYTPAAPLPGGRDLVAPLRGGRGFSAKILRNFLQKSPWRTGRPTAGRPAPQAARQWGGRPRPPGSGSAASQSALACSTRRGRAGQAAERARGRGARDNQSASRRKLADWMDTCGLAKTARSYHC